MSQETFMRLEHLRRLNSNRQWVNYDVYRLLFKEDLYILAYERIKSKPGNMTPGTDEETLDGFSLEAMVLTLRNGGSKVGKEGFSREGQDHAESETNVHEGIQAGSRAFVAKQWKITGANRTRPGRP